MTEAAARGVFAPRAAAVMNHATILPPSVREVPNECEAEGVYPVGSRHSRAAAVVQNQAQRQGFAPLAARPRRSKANFAGVRLWQTPRFHRLLLLFPQIFCYAKSLREPCHQPTGLFSLRRADLSTNNSRANRLLPQTPPPSNPCQNRYNRKRSRLMSTPFSVAQRQGFEPW